MFKWQHPIFSGDELFPTVVQPPPVLITEVVPPPPDPNYDYSKRDLRQLSLALLDKLRPQIIQWSLAQRQMAFKSGHKVYRTRKEFAGATAMYTLLYGHEQMLVKLFPVPPIKKPEEDKCLLVFHDTHKVTAFAMKDLEADSPAMTLKLARELTSSWGTDLLKASQYMFDAADGGVAMSPIKITNNRVSRSETHCFVSVKDKFTQFFDTSTLSARTPHMNGGAKRYFTANDEFEFSSSGLRYVGGYGQGDTPFAISAEGAYYYKFAIAIDTFHTLSNEPQEVERIGNLKTDAQIDTDVAGYEAAYPSEVNYPNAPYLTTAELGGIISGLHGSTGYGVYQGGGYTTVYRYAVNNGSNTDLSGELPMSVFTQQKGVDTLSVVLVPYTASLFYSAGIGSPTIATFVQLLHVAYSMFKPPGAYPGSPAADPYDAAFSSFPMYRTWSLTFPPALSTAVGQYYFADAGKIRTPYGNYDYSLTAPHNNHMYILRDAYKPWFHLSNGKTYLQGFEVSGERKVFCKGMDITQMLADACKTDITNIQGCLIDFPIAKVRDLA